MRKIGLSLFAILLAVSQLLGQNRQVTGIVTGDDGAPMPGVTVLIQGTQTGVLTNNSGSYSISAPADGVLVFSFLGMQSVEEQIGGRTTINVSMTATATAIDDVIVTAVGIQRSERSLGYSVASVKPEEAIMRAEPDPLRALDGKIPGVAIGATSGAAGSATRVTIRGASSFMGNNQPLYVVDGVPYSNAEVRTTNQDTGGGSAYSSGISTLDPNDIETMNVLKGAAAAALYGSRAANGVIVITTKSGSKKGLGRKGMEVTVNAGYTIETIGALPDYQNTFGQGSSFAAAGSNGSWGANFADVSVIRADQALGDAFFEAYPTWAADHYPGLVDAAGRQAVPYRAYKNNVKDIFKNSGIYELSVNLQSTAERGNFGATVSRLKQDSYVPGSEFERFNLAIGGNHRLDNGIRFGGSVSFGNSVQSGALYGGNPGGSVYTNSSSLARAFIIPRSMDLSNLPYEAPDGSNLLASLTGSANNPYWAFAHDYARTETNRAVANFTLGYDLTDWLSADYVFGYNYFDNKRKQVIDRGGTAYSGIGNIKTDDYRAEEMEGTFSLSFNNINITDDIGFRATAGHNFNQYTTKRLIVDGTGIVNPGIYSVGNTEAQTAEERYSRTRLWGLFADMVFDYRQWLFLNLSGRYDFSSTLPTNNRSYFYPAVSTSFVFTDAFELQSKAIDFGKIRVGWARVGNDASAYYVNGYYNQSDSPYLDQSYLYFPTTMFDENLKPEFTSEIEVGLEMSFLRNRLGFELTLYNKNTTDQIAPRGVATSSAFSTYYTNFGKLNNKGIEVGINAVPVIAGDFRWSLFGTYTLNKSEVKELTEGLDELRVTGSNFSDPYAKLVVGGPYAALYGTVIARDTDGTPLVDPTSGEYYVDNEFGYLGNPAPKYKVSLSNTFSFKGINLNILMDYSKGGKVYTSYLSDLLGRGVTKDTEDRYGTRIRPGVYGTTDANGNYVAMTDSNGNRIQNTTQTTEMDLWFGSGGNLTAWAINSASEMNTYDATVVRLRELSIGWDLPKKWIDKTFMGSVSVSFVGRNLWHYAPNVPKYSNYDPTINTLGASNVQGIDYTGIPPTRRYGFNLRFTF